jgi:ferredoxin
MESLYRFPAPDFQSGYQIPWPDTPLPETAALFFIDLALLVLALGCAAWFIFRKRSRSGLRWLSAISLLYFGFIRGGCVCAVGSIQNVCLALADGSYRIPVTVLAFFGIPLVAALFAGRLYCAGACPLGAIQDLVLLKPLRVPARIDRPLRLLAPFYLGLAVLAAATGSGFLICRFDPFVALFRLSGPLYMTIAGLGLLLVSLFVWRPYCRYLCPYGVLLGWLSRFSWQHLSLRASQCADCGYCVDSCPEDAVLAPLLDAPEPRQRGVRRLVGLVLLLPLLGALGTVTGYFLHAPAARLNPVVRLADRVAGEEAGRLTATSQHSTAFRESGQSVASLYTAAAQVVERFRMGTAILGLCLGTLFGLHLLSAALVRRAQDYRIDKASCFSCGRCFESCPVERKAARGDRSGPMDALDAPEAVS